MSLGKLTIYGKKECSYCTNAQTVCGIRGIPFEYLLLGQDFEVDELQARMGDVTLRTFPQIFEGQRRIGGYDDLVKELAGGSQ